VALGSAFGQPSVRGSGLAECGSAAASVAAVWTVATGVAGLSARRRTRAQLGTEIDIWKSLPEGDVRNAMQTQVVATGARLLLMESPEYRRLVRLQAATFSNATTPLSLAADC
jgi:hypothetical protein